MSKYYLVPLTGYYAGQYAVVGDSHYAIKTCKTFTEATRMMEQLEREDRETPHERKSADIPREVARKAHTWMDEEAFGSHVLLPIRTEKTAVPVENITPMYEDPRLSKHEAMWKELKCQLITRKNYLQEVVGIACAVGDAETAAKVSDLYNEVNVVLMSMDSLDT